MEKPGLTFRVEPLKSVVWGTLGWAWVSLTQVKEEINHQKVSCGFACFQGGKFHFSLELPQMKTGLISGNFAKSTLPSVSMNDIGVQLKNTALPQSDLGFSLALPFDSWITLGRSLNLSEMEFPSLENVNTEGIYFLGFP